MQAARVVCHLWEVRLLCRMPVGLELAAEHSLYISVRNSSMMVSMSYSQKISPARFGIEWATKRIYLQYILKGFSTLHI